MSIDRIIELLLQGVDEKRADNFVRFFSKKLWGMYNDYLMDQVKTADGLVNWPLDLPNAKENIAYEKKVTMPPVNEDKMPGVRIVIDEVAGLDQALHGLSVKIDEGKRSFTISGTPTLEQQRVGGHVPSSTIDLTLRYHFEGLETTSDKPTLERKTSFVINQDPRKLWRAKPVDWDQMPEPRYRKVDEACEYVKVKSTSDGTPREDMVAASKRGRSHAQEGKPRDDDFRLVHTDNGWYVMAVADGAGSAPYSREGSRIACEKALEHCILKLSCGKQLEADIKLYCDNLQDTDSEVALKKLGDAIYPIVVGAALKAHKAIDEEAKKQHKPMKQYATTLLLAICKKFDFGWFIATFWVGDGAIGLYDRQGHTVKILGQPDEGEFAGQTRFLTMPDIFKDPRGLYQRMRLIIAKDFTALMLMTDGVSDPKFETDANLQNVERWDELWDDLKAGGVELTDDNEAAKDQLLQWLDFWSPGNHDDRTIAILYGDKIEEEKTTAEEEPDETLQPNMDPPAAEQPTAEQPDEAGQADRETLHAQPEAEASVTAEEAEEYEKLLHKEASAVTAIEEVRQKKRGDESDSKNFTSQPDSEQSPGHKSL